MAVLSKIRQHSVIMIGVIALALFSFIIQDLFTKGNFGKSSKDVGSINGKDIAFEDFRLKVSNLEKSGQQISSTEASRQVWEQEVTIALLSAEFDKLGLRVGEKHILDVLKADPNIGKNPMFLNSAGMFDVAKFKDGKAVEHWIFMDVAEMNKMMQAMMPSTISTPTDTILKMPKQ